MIKAVYSHTLLLKAGGEGLRAGRRGPATPGGLLGVLAQHCGPSWRWLRWSSALPTAITGATLLHRAGAQAHLPANLTVPSPAAAWERPPEESLALQ